MSLSTRIATGVLSTAFACLSVTAGAQTAGATTGQTPDQSTAGQSSTQTSAEQQATRQHLTAAQQALAELTKLPAAATLQGDQRTLVAGFINDFNAFATATTDWRTKYKTASESLDKVLAAAGAAEGSGAPKTDAPDTSTSTTPPSAPGAPAAAGSTAPGAPAAGEAAAGGWDPAIVSKLKEVRQHLDAFEQSSGDPVFMVDAIEEVLESASSQGGTLTPAQIDQIRQSLAKIRAAATR